MSDNSKNIVLKREGSDQNQRFVNALDPSTVKLNDFSLKEWMLFAYNFASHVNFFKEPDNEVPYDNWELFFKDEEELEEFLKQVDTGKNITPHLALFVCFVKLLDYSKKRFNLLTKRHLDFYYNEILNIEKLPAVPDKVNLIFELAKKASDTKIDTGTEVNGGKDSKGQNRIYKTENELIVNNAKVVSLKSLYNDHENRRIKAAYIANSFDGKGGGFPIDEIKWHPFGYYVVTKEKISPEYPELADASIGFAVSSDILKLKEGNRTIILDIKFTESLSELSIDYLKDNIEVWCTGEKKWLGPYRLISVIQYGPGKLELKCEIKNGEDSIVPYKPEVHGDNFDTTDPICRFLLNTKEEGHNIYRELIDKSVEELSIKVNIEEAKSLLLESDFGVLNAAKPFYPFGTQPVKGSGFYIGYPELFDKKWDKINIKIDWKNTPDTNLSGDSFKDLYFAYRQKHLSGLGASEYMSSIYMAAAMEFESAKEKNNYLSNLIIDPDNLIVNSYKHFQSETSIMHNKKWEPTEDNQILFIQEDDGSYSSEFNLENSGYNTDSSTPIRISLKQSFYHEIYPRIYALAFSTQSMNKVLPNEPYTPMIESIRLGYSATSSSKNLKLFHLHPFGQSEQKRDEEKKFFLLPEYCNGGELYIGLENAEPTQVISLLIQVMEGSENPEAETFTGNQKIEWLALCGNHWKRLNSNYLIADNTDNFLKSGIVRFSLPKDANNYNTLLPSGLTWIKAKIHKSYDSVCKVISIMAQAVTAQFADNNNDLSHLKNGLEANSIAKLVQRSSSIKSISQPFSSYGGKPQESDMEYYRRISERLRHKNRAVTIWDYEHLILQKFPEIYKVKCLNHTSYENKKECFQSPGNVLIIVIPDIINNQIFNIFQPRVSQAKLNEIENFINERTGIHQKTVVANPKYDVVTVELEVKFHNGLDESFYLKKLNEDIIRILSPWAFKETSKIEFGSTLHKSNIINWIERLKYVDWIKDLNLHKDGKTYSAISPESPISILVSARNHKLKLVSESCNGIIESEEICKK